MKVIVELAELSVDVRQKIAESCTSPQTLSKLAEDKEWRVRLVVANNVNTSTEDLLKLGKDENDNVKKAVVQRLTHLLTKVIV